jgi:methylmalonyl-CoA/ethylmalonyl-CoA epimerase
MKFHHIGYLVNNFNSAFKNFKKCNYKKKKSIIIDNNLKVKIQFLVNGNNIIELVKPHKNNIGLLSLLRKKNYAYHFAYKVKNLDKTLVRLKKNFKIIVNPVPAKAFNDKKVAFLKMKNDFIIELIQS